MIHSFEIRLLILVLVFNQKNAYSNIIDDEYLKYNAIKSNRGYLWAFIKKIFINYTLFP